MKIVDVLKQKQYFAAAFFSAVFMFFFLPYVQTLGSNTDLWYLVISGEGLALFIAFCALFGVFVSFQISRFRGPKTCGVVKKGTAGGFAGSAFGFFAGVCPACAGFAGLFFPVAVVTTLTVFGWVFMLASMGLMVLGIYMNGGFRT